MSPHLGLIEKIGTMSLAAIGREYGLSRERVRQLAEREGKRSTFGQEKRAMRRQRKQDKKAAKQAARQVLAERIEHLLVTTDLSVVRIAALLGIKRGRVALVSARGGQRTWRHGRWNKLDVEKIQAMWREGNTDAEIAVVVGGKPRSVYYVRRRNGWTK